MEPKKADINWQAPEYTEHHHSAGWYLLLIIGTVVVAALTYLVTKDIFATVIVAFMGFIVGIAASRKPQTVKFSLSGNSLSIGSKSYLLAGFKSFSVADEDKLVSATLAPLKRFALPLSVYMLPQDADAVLDALNARLAHDDKLPDLTDRLAHHLRF